MPLLITRVCDTDDYLNPGGRGWRGDGGGGISILKLWFSNLFTRQILMPFLLT